MGALSLKINQISYGNVFTESILHLPESPSLEHLEYSYLPMSFPYAVDLNNETFFDMLFTELSSTRPCDLTTNLFFNKRASVQDLKKRSQTSASYFYSFRVCDAESVKISRKIDGRPVFYPAHLPPAYTSWVVVRQNYTSNRKIHLKLEGLIFARQVKGKIAMTLSPRPECEDVCSNQLTTVLDEGQGLLFLSDLWDFSYSPETENGDSSITFLTETDWK